MSLITEPGREHLSRAARGMRAALAGLLANAALVAVELVAGIPGHSHALAADAIESSADLFSSPIVRAGLRVTARPHDRLHPPGYGEAEALAGFSLRLMSHTERVAGSAWPIIVVEAEDSSPTEVPGNGHQPRQQEHGNAGPTSGSLALRVARRFA